MTQQQTAAQQGQATPTFVREDKAFDCDMHEMHVGDVVFSVLQRPEHRTPLRIAEIRAYGDTRHSTIVITRSDDGVMSVSLSENLFVLA